MHFNCIYRPKMKLFHLFPIFSLCKDHFEARKQRNNFSLSYLSFPQCKAWIGDNLKVGTICYSTICFTYPKKYSNTECGTFGVVVTRLNGKKHRDTNKNWDNGNRVIQSTIMAGSGGKNEMRIGSQTFSIIVSIHGLLSDFVRY